MGSHLIISSDKDTHFTGELVTNARENESLVIRAGEVVRGQIESLSIIADQNLAWDVFVFETDNFSNADMDVDSFVDFESFTVASGVQIAGAGSFYYGTSALDIPYTAGDGKIHLSLVNRSAGLTKTAGAAGEVVVKIGYRIDGQGG